MEKPAEGLSSAEARRIRTQVGPNAAPDVAVHTLRLMLSKFLAPVSILLEIAIVLQLVLGDISKVRLSQRFSYSIPPSDSFTKAGLSRRSRR